MLLAACTEPSAPEPIVPTLTSITVALSATTITVGQTTQATASGVDQNDAPIATGAVTWTSNANATVSADGVVTAVAPGVATIVASAAGKSGQKILTITALPATGLVLSGAPSTTSANGSALVNQPVVRLKDAANGFAAQAGVVVSASVSEGALIGATTATTDASGIATFAGLGLSGKVGVRTLTFAAPNLAATTANVTLTTGAPTNIAVNSGNQQTVAAGASVPVAPSVLVTDANGNVVSAAPVEFTVTSGAGSITGGIATTNSSGIATLGSWTLGAPGLNTLQAKVMGQSAAVALSAMATQAPALATINVTLASSTIQAGQTTQATAAGVDQYGASIATGALTWTSNSPNATVTSNGLVSGVSAGFATITASANGKSGQATVAVTAVPVVTTLSVSVAPTSIQIGQAAQATATALDQFGAAIATGLVTWSATGGVTINASGVATGVSAGPAQISATAAGKTAQTTITVAAAPTIPVLASLVLSVTPASIQVGQTAQAVVVGSDQFGAPIATGPVTWLATNNAIISQNGLITGASAGAATITANAGAFSAQATITITGAPTAPVLTSMSLSLNPASIAVGQTTQPIVLGRDQFGAPIATCPITWSITGPATVSSSGLVTGTGAGAVRVTAIVGSISTFGDITVTGPPPNSPTLTTIVVSLSPSTIIGGETSQATAQGFDQYGAPIATGPITWSLPFYVVPRMSISSSGLITSQEQYDGGGGLIPITATAGNVSGSAGLKIRIAVKITGTISKDPLLIGESADVTFAAFDQLNAPIVVPLGINVHCPTGCNGAAALVRTSNTTATVTGAREGSVTVEASTPYGPGGSIYLGAVTFNVVKPPELSYMTVNWPTSLQVGQTVNIPVSGRDQFGNPFPLGAVGYYACQTYLASITQFGDLTVLRPGTFSVTILGSRPNAPDISETRQFTVAGTPTARLEVTAVPPGPIVNRVETPSNSPIIVQVVDIASGQPINWQGLPVTASLTSGGGTLTGNTYFTTGALGFERFTYWVFSGPAGPKTVTFTAPGVNPATWQFVLQAGTASALSISAGANQTAVAGTPVPIRPTVKVTDVDGNAVSGASVVFTVTSGGGSVTGASVTTDANGLAQVGSWTLGPGANSLRAQAAGVGTPVTFSATGTP